MKNTRLNNPAKALLKLSILSLTILYPLHSNALNVATWVDLNTTEDILLTADIQAEGATKVITLNTDNQIIDGGNHSLIGATGYKIIVKGNNSTIQNFGKVVDGTAENHTYLYTDTDGNTVYKTIEKSINGFTNTVPFNFSKYFSINNSVFSDNNNTSPILKISNGASIRNSVFYNNKNTGSWENILDLTGGATFNIDNTIFDSNQTEGAILCVGSPNTSVTINNSIFQNNITTYMGVIDIEKGKVDITNSQFINNRNYQGGAISQTRGFSSITDTLFKGNVATSNYEGSGGAINLPIQDYDPNQPYFVNVTFEDNQAKTYGGGIYISGAGTPNHYGYFINSKFDGNVAALGGGILTSNMVELLVVDTSFTNNTAEVGGAIYAADLALTIYAQTKDVIFAGNIASDEADDFNGGAAVFFESSDGTAEMNINAASGRKVVFDNTIAAYSEEDSISTIDMNINKSGLSYEDINNTNVNIDNSGEIEFNDRIADGGGKFFNINLYGGKLSIGQNATLNADFEDPDALLNDNNFSVKGAATLRTANGVIGEFNPQTFSIDATLKYEFDVDLANAKSDKLVGATINNGGSLNLSVLNIISDSDVENLKITYSDTNIGGILQDDYTITTSSATYDVTAGNDDTGSYLLFTKTGEEGGLANAIKNAADAYSITSGSDEVVTAWQGNNLLADMIINGNGQAITTENNLDGINIDSSRTLTMNGVSDMTGFNYAFSNDGTVKLTNTAISDNIINNGTLEINENVSLGEVSGAGIININADHELNATLTADTVNVKNAELSGVNNLSSDVNLNVLGGIVALDNQGANVKSASFDANSTLSLAINSATDYGNLTAENITVAEGAKLQATLAQGLVKAGETLSLQLLSADNTDFNNFSDSFDNNMYHFEKDGKDGKYNIYLAKTAEDVVEDAGGQHWVAEAAKAYIDGNSFESGSVAADVANKLAVLAQTDAKALITEIKAIAPMESTVVQGQAVDEVNRLFRIIDDHLHGKLASSGLSSGDSFSDVIIWANPYVGQSKLDDRGQTSGLDTNSRGIVASIEKKVNPQFRIGAGLQYDKTAIDAFRRNIDTDTIVGFAYGEYKPSRWFFNAAISYGYSKYDERKYALGSRYSADYNSRTLSINAITGYQFKYLTPEVGMRYYNIKRNGYTDSALQKISTANTDILRMVGGVHFSKDYSAFSPDIRLGLTYDVIAGQHNTLVNLANNTSYIVEGKRLPRLGYELDINLNTHLADNVVIGLGYTGSYRKNYQEHTGMFMFRYSF